MIAVIVIVGIVVLLLLSVVVSYNRLIAQRNSVQTAWADVDAELKRRCDLVPNLVNTVQGYAAYERAVFEEVARARASAQRAQGAAAASAIERSFEAALDRLFAFTATHPELKENRNFLQLQAMLSDTEDRLQAARRNYNDSVEAFNRRVETFPASLVASWFDFHRASPFTVDDAERTTVSEAARTHLSGVAQAVGATAVPAPSPPSATWSQPPPSPPPPPSDSSPPLPPSSPVTPSSPGSPGPPPPVAP